MAERKVAGLDTLDTSDTALLDSMRNEGAAPELDAVASDLAPVAAAEPDDLDVDLEPEAEAQPEGDRKVSLKALQEERNRRKTEVEQRRKAEQALEVEKARFAERINMLTQAVQATAPQPAQAAAVEIPDVNTDPIGHFKAALEIERKAREEQSAIIRGFQENQQRAVQAAELRNWGAAQETEFATREPTYREGMDFLMASRHGELQKLGIADQAERNRIIAQDVTNIAQMARQNGTNFAEQLYGVAQSRGFTPKAATPAIPALDATPAADATARAQRGRDSATTIGTAGSAPAPALTPERIANMPEHEFAAYLKKIEGNPAQLRQLMGA